MVGQISQIINKIRKLIGFPANGDSEAKRINIYAPFDGVVVAQRKIPDEGFSEGYMGSGIGLKPLDSGEVVAPISGKLEVVFRTQHAYIIRESSQGIAVMLHLGINTVDIPQERGAFKTTWSQGQEIKEKEPLCQMDLSVIRSIMEEQAGKRNSGEANSEEKFTSDVSALLVQNENMENKKVIPVKQDGETVSRGELLLQIV